MNGEENGAREVECDQAAFRIAIGVLGMSLPFVLALGGWTFYDRGGFFEALATSISAYYHFGEATAGYHPAMRDVFVGVLFLIGLSLIYYRGYEQKKEPWSDNLVANVAGSSAIAVALLPTSDGLASAELAELAVVSGGFHVVFASLFFVSLIYFCWSIFTRTGNAEITVGKRKRNRIYKSCAVIIAIALVLIAAIWILELEELQQTWKAVFWLEAIAVVTFGFSWWTKANTTVRALFGKQ